jgi:transposase
MMYVDIDVGKHRRRAAMMDKEGHVVNEFGFSNDSDGILDLSSMLSMDDRIVMESTGSYWMNIYDKLEDADIAVVLAHPLKTKTIASARIKSDRVDARILAHLLSQGRPHT